eukprot:TRINITY_DN67337_c1_g1_i1.p1 TRINITY_DN67337_c1_g1~~TRINITY_DN67337_c1_g1_i1.p1  ORF type:complete len:300 (+),score=22.70 TRINITY_DN67337_c1_g1_i1:147-1046(+)
MSRMYSLMVHVMVSFPDVMSIREAPLTPKPTRELSAELLFETFNIPALYWKDTCTLPIFATGNTTGLVIDGGHSLTHIACVYDGLLLPASVETMPFGGHDLTKFMLELAKAEPGGNALSNCSTEEQWRVAEEMKHQCSCVNSVWDMDFKACQKDYELPDGSKVELCESRTECGEALFEPGLFLHKQKPASQDLRGVADRILDSLWTVDIDVRLSMVKPIVTAGGGCQLQGLDSRIQGEIVNRWANCLNTKMLVNGSNLDLASWQGGSVLTCISDFLPLWVSKSDYEEFGPPICSTRCVV